ncbi:hypothetical protein EG329_011102 [Mollisiaceae sp. DMI_Dod_QoI]|nr:hypothetical protein EG329_011102 [Helotiales sp. DMI_Dod_QoI]
MAHGTKACQGQASGEGQPLSDEGPCPSQDRPPNQETLWEERVSIDSQRRPAGPTQGVTESLSTTRLQALERDQKHESILARNEETTMLESPRGGSQGHPTTEAKITNKSREVAYASSAGEGQSRNGRPPRQDLAYRSIRAVESSGSEVDFDVQARQLRARERIIIRRERVRRTRRLVRACKQRVQRLRDDVRDAVDKLTRKLNELRALNLELRESTDSYYEKLRVAQDELGPVEDEYDGLERRLEEEEDDLEEEEDHFFRHNDLVDVSVPETKINATLSPLAEPQVLDTDPTDLVLENSLVREYLDRVEEAERLKEDVEDLENEYLQVSGDATFRKRHNIPLSDETSNFLNEYPTLHAEALNDLHDAEDALFDTRDKCLEQGLFTDSEYAYEPRDALCDDIMDSVYEARDRSLMRVAVHHLHYNEKDADFGDKKDYVNKWLLQWVEESSVGALLLRAFIYFEFPDNANMLGDEKWSELAVENWDNDQAGDSANRNNRESRLDTIAGITPGAAGKLHATSTARSGVSSSLRTLDVIADEEAPDEPLDLRSESASHTTQQATPKRRSTSNINEQITPMSLSTDTMSIVSSQDQTPKANIFEPTESEQTIHSASIQTINSPATSGRVPSPHTPSTATKFLHNLSTFLNNEEHQDNAHPADDGRTGPCEADRPSIPENKSEIVNPAGQSVPHFDNTDTVRSVSMPLGETRSPLTIPQNDEFMLKTRPAVDDSTENINRATLAPDKRVSAQTLEASTLDQAPCSASSHLDNTIFRLEASPKSDDNAEIMSSRRTRGTPSITTPLEALDISKHTRAKSIDTSQSTLRINSAPVPGFHLRVADAQIVRHRRSLSPHSLLSTASRTLRRYSSFGALRHVDANTSPT